MLSEMYKRETNINTGGGSNIEGNINTGGGYFIGRDQNILISIINVIQSTPYIDGREQSKLHRKRKKVLRDENLYEKLGIIEKHVQDEWRCATGRAGAAENLLEIWWYPFYGPSHNANVEDILYGLIPSEKYKMLSQDQWFILLAAVWLHDIGMSQHDKDETFETIHNDHHERSRNYVTQVLAEEIPAHLLDRVAKLCGEHRLTSFSANSRNTDRVTTNDDVEILRAYLRLADSLHIDHTRVKFTMYEIMCNEEVPWETRFHWLKCMWIMGVKTDADKQSISITLYSSSNFNTQHPNIQNNAQLAEELEESLKSEFRDLLEILRGTFVQYWISCFSITECIISPIGPVTGTETFQKMRIGLNSMFSYRKLKQQSSAGDSAINLIDTISNFWNLLDDRPQLLYRELRKFLKETQIIYNDRATHTLLAKVLSCIDYNTLEDIDWDSPSSLVKITERLRIIKDDLSALKQQRVRNEQIIAYYAEPFLTDGGNILLYGYSNLVVECFRKLKESLNRPRIICVAEERVKTKFSLNNRIVHHEGIKYVLAIQRICSVWVPVPQVVIIPDIVVANLFVKGAINKVIFGANGIHWRTGMLGSTAGHQAVADLAYLYNVPVYVIADAEKFESLRWNPNAVRDIPWLLGNKKPVTQNRNNREKEASSVSLNLEQMDYETYHWSSGDSVLQELEALNPREDIVDPSRITMFITNVGAFPPTQIPNIITDKFTKS